MALKVIKKRFIYAFGGTDIDNKVPKGNVETFRVLDTSNLNKYWCLLYLESPQPTGGQYGVISLG